jgi:thiamine biosynthesis lipoprotein ApbE
MDPFSGYPADRRLQATAVARTGIAADALSTAMLVAGRRCRGRAGHFRLRIRVLATAAISVSVQAGRSSSTSVPPQPSGSVRVLNTITEL